MNDDEIWELAGFVSASIYRKSIMLSLQENVKIPSEIAEDINLRTNHVSNILKDLKDKELVFCLNSDAKKGRLYKITDLGNKVMKVLK